MNKLKITLLTENSVGVKNWATCLAEWGLSLLIEYKCKRILFDTGMTDIFIRNAKALKIDIKTIDALVFSHNHKDHTGGLKNLHVNNKIPLIMHPRVLDIISKDIDKTFLGKFDVKPIKEVTEIFPDIFFLGEIPRLTDFESGKVGNDAMLDDTAIAVKTELGVVVITGCSHSGIVNICEYAKKVTNQPLYAVVGGFHLLDVNSNQLEKTIEYFKSENPKYLYPTHCVDNVALASFYNVFKNQKVATGDIIEL